MILLVLMSSACLRESLIKPRILYVEYEVCICNKLYGQGDKIDF